jgi:6-phosphofructokinase 2
VGAGDSMIAGMVMGMIQDKPLPEVFEQGIACGVSAVMTKGPDLCEPETFAQALSQIKLVRI